MSDQELNTFLEEITVSISVLETKSVEEKAGTINEIMNSLSSKAESGSLSVMAFMELIGDSAPNGEEDEELTTNFLGFRQIEKQVLVKLMYLVYQEGLICDSPDLDKRKFWYERLTNLTA